MLNNAPTNNKSILEWLEDKLALVNPDKVVWIDGSDEQIEALRAEACATGEMIKLNQDLLPDCYLHRTAVNDVARVEGRTFICASTKEEAGPTNNWIPLKHTKCFTASLRTATRAEQLISFLTQWAPLVQSSQRLVSSLQTQSMLFSTWLS